MYMQAAHGGAAAEAERVGQCSKHEKYVWFPFDLAMKWLQGTVQRSIFTAFFSRKPDDSFPPLNLTNKSLKTVVNVLDLDLDLSPL